MRDKELEKEERKLKKLTYKEKFIQMNKEAKATWILAVICFLVWLAGGFGVYGLVGNSWTICKMPAWFVLGSFGSWITAIIGVVILTKKVFVDFDLEDDEEEE